MERVRRGRRRPCCSPGCSFNEVAPGGASQAANGTADALAKLASTKSLLVERVRPPTGQQTPSPSSLQRSRSWWSESGTPTNPPCHVSSLLQRSRSWWSESGCGGCRRWRGGSAGFNEVAPGGASQAKFPDLSVRLSMASTKSLLVERVRLAMKERVDAGKNWLQRSRSWWSESGDGVDPDEMRAEIASTKSLLVERVRRGFALMQRERGKSLQRSRSWWSESGPAHRNPPRRHRLLQRSRSWWSESGALRA